MKIKVLILMLTSVIGFGNAWAQQLENDDMYFNSKDRAKLRATKKTEEVTYASARKESKKAGGEDNLNPTDTYSARNVNPEYTSRMQSQIAKAEDEDYFVNNYQYSNPSNYNSNNNNWNNMNSGYGNPWYQSSYWSPSVYAWNSPYGYGNGYGNGWNSPGYGYDPYSPYNGYNGMSSSFYYGNSWNYGMGGNYSYWNRPMCAFYSPYSASFAVGTGWYSNYYRSTNTIAVNNREASRAVTHGKRPTRGGYVASDDYYNTSRSRSGISSNEPRGNDVSGGRVSSRPPEYYNRSWRGSDASAPASSETSYGSRSTTQNNRSSLWSNSSSNSNSSWGNSNSSPSPSRSSSSFESGGGATRSHSPSSSSPSSGASSTGRSRGQ